MPSGVFDLAPDSVVHSVSTPEYRTEPPQVRNAGLIPPTVRGMMAAAWDQRTVAANSVTVHRLTRCIVAGEGLVFDQDMRVLRHTLSAYADDAVAAVAAQIRQAAAAGTVRHLPGTTMVCKKRGVGNYGHWMAEMLPAAFVGLPWAASWRFLVPRDAEALGQVIRASLGLLGITEANWLECGDEPVLCDEVLVVCGLGNHGVSMSPVVMECLDRVGAMVSPGYAERVWVSRAGAHRALWNESEVETVLTAAGWHIAHPGRIALLDQIALFKGARRIAGVAGAGLANLAFALPGASVTCFMPAAMPDTFFWLLSGLRGVHYHEVRCLTAQKAHGISPWDAHLVMSLPDVLAHLE